MSKTDVRIIQFKSVSEGSRPINQEKEREKFSKEQQIQRSVKLG